MRSLLTVTLMLSCATAVAGRASGEPSYEDTRVLLLEVETAPANAALRKLFREASKRQAALLRALDDSEPRVQLHALLVIDLVALPDLTRGLETWLTSLRGTDRIYLRPKFDPLDAQLATRTFGGDPVHVTRRHFFGNRRGSYRLIARNKESKTVLVEVVFGEGFTEGWYVVLRRDGSDWRPILKTNMWVS
jgi:hypothetical protein